MSVQVTRPGTRVRSGPSSAFCGCPHWPTCREGALSEPPGPTQTLSLNAPAEPLDGKLPFWLGPGGFAAAAGMLIGVEAV